MENQNKSIILKNFLKSFLLLIVLFFIGGSNTQATGDIVVSSISSGYIHSCALLNDGSIKCWGYNGFGQLGDGTTTSRLTPIAVHGIANATAISAGYSHTCALLNDGSVKCWGYNGSGELGDGTTTSRLNPITVTGINNAIAISSGEHYTCAILIGGSIKCWGNNVLGQLGDGTTTSKFIPISVSGIINAIGINSGVLHTCAIISGGSVKCWGYNGSGQLGDGTSTSSLIPVDVSKVTNVTTISAEFYNTCTLLTGGEVNCWGNNNSGQFTVPEITNSITINSGENHTCAIISGGSIKCWGNNISGQLGDGSNTSRLTPIAVYGITNATVINAGYSHTCALLLGGNVKCWGSNDQGQLGNGTTINSNIPVDVIGLGVNPLPSTFTCGTSTVNDSDGNSYGTTDVNGQCWMKENMRVGTMVTGTTTQTNNAVIEKYCYDNNLANCSTDGGLYQWDEAMQYSTTEGAQGICPTGWHIPTDTEQYNLENYLKDAGASCDSNRNNGWDCNSAGTKMKSGIPPGLNFPLAGLLEHGIFVSRPTNTQLWSSSLDRNNVWNRAMYFGTGTVDRFARNKEMGLSIRCIKDSSSLPPVINHAPTLISLDQYFTASNGVKHAISEGGSAETPNIVLIVGAEDQDADIYHLEYEVRPIQELFTGTGNTVQITGPIMFSGIYEMPIIIPNEGNYHWRVRVVDNKDMKSEWKEYGNAGNTDFSYALNNNESTTTLYGIPVEFKFDHDLTIGSNISDIRYLQIILNSNSGTHIPVPNKNETCWDLGYIGGSSGCETQKFGEITKQAVIKFQELYADKILTPVGLTKGTGYVNERTRIVLNDILSKGMAIRKASSDGLLDENGRKNSIITIVNNLWQYLDLNLKMTDMPKEILLAMIVQETGPAFQFNNEWMRVNDVIIKGKPNDFGRGLMQITSEELVGKSDTDNSLPISTLRQECKNGKNLNYQCSKYYSNTTEGIMRNIGDGLKSLINKYYIFKPTPTAEKGPYKLNNEWKYKWNDLDYTISLNEMRNIVAVKGYNGFGIPCNRLNNGNDYIRSVGKHLTKIRDYFPSILEKDADKAKRMGELLQIADVNKKIISICSPGTLRIIDADKNITGENNGEVIHDIPNIAYDDENHKTAELYSDDESYKYQVIGTESGTYSFYIDKAMPTGVNTVELHNVPLALGEIYTYQVDWDALARGEKGVMVENDKKGDGTIVDTFSVGANVNDITPPTTTSTNTGSFLYNGWYTGTTTINLTATDNPGGVGVKETKYSLNKGTTWNTYTGSINVSKEGINTIQFYSIDWFGNTEQIKTQQIKIDKTAPEAKVSPSIDKIGVDVTGTDNLSKVTVTKVSDSNYTLTDEAGNTTKIVIKTEKQKGKVKKLQPKASYKIVSIQYNKEKLIKIANNDLTFEWYIYNKQYNLLNQYLEVYGKFEIEAEYKIKKNQTNILIRTKGKPKKETLDGLKITRFETNKGVLNYGY